MRWLRDSAAAPSIESAPGTVQLLNGKISSLSFADATEGRAEKKKSSAKIPPKLRGRMWTSTMARDKPGHCGVNAIREPLLAAERCHRLDARCPSCRDQIAGDRDGGQPCR